MLCLRAELGRFARGQTKRKNAHSCYLDAAPTHEQGKKEYSHTEHVEIRRIWPL